MSRRLLSCCSVVLNPRSYFPIDILYCKFQEWIMLVFFQVLVGWLLFLEACLIPRIEVEIAVVSRTFSQNKWLGEALPCSASRPWFSSKDLSFNQKTHSSRSKTAVLLLDRRCLELFGRG